MSQENFLSQPIELGMFVPTDEKGNFLPEPERYEHRVGFDEVNMEFDIEEVERYIEAKKKCLFKGFRYDSEEEAVMYDFEDGSIDIIGLVEFDGATIGDLNPDYELSDLGKIASKVI